jgi:hypothetical protein
VKAYYAPHPDVQYVPTRWGFNAYASQEDAEQVARWLGLLNSRWFIWRLADGTFNFSNTSNPTSLGRPAELVNTISC